MTQNAWLRVRYVAFLAAALAVAALPALSASALCITSCSDSSSASASMLATIQVDRPDATAVLTNGDTIDIGGWTTGSRVDAYLDGPAGVGEGIGSVEVNEFRPDAASLTGRPDSGFDLAWEPMDLTSGEHMLYVYALADDGNWILQTVPVMGEGNAFSEPVTGRANEDGGPDADASSL